MKKDFTKELKALDKFFRELEEEKAKRLKEINEKNNPKK